MSVVRWIVGATIFLGLLFLSLDNADTVTLRFFRVVSWQAPLVFVVFSAFAIGVALGLLAGVLRASRLKRQLNRLRREHRGIPSSPGPHGASPTARIKLPPPDVV
jgi:lipopolysaccharide assembly protein A